MYSVLACKEEYLAKYPDLQIQETSLAAHIRDAITDLFELAMSTKSNLFESLQYLRKLLMI